MYVAFSLNVCAGLYIICAMFTVVYIHTVVLQKCIEPKLCHCDSYDDVYGLGPTSLVPMTSLFTAGGLPAW